MMQRLRAGPRTGIALAILTTEALLRSRSSMNQTEEPVPRTRASMPADTAGNRDERVAYGRM